MGASSSTVATVPCGAGGVCARGAEPQEYCTYHDACDWNLTKCHSTLMPECVCPPEPYLSIATSNLPPFLSTPADVAICTLGFVAPWAFFVVIVLLKTRVRWKLASEWPVALSMVPPNVGLWLQSSIAIVVALAVFAARAPSDVWGECALKGVCVYHDMFCEATHHASAIRHPANFWSNVPSAS